MLGLSSPVYAVPSTPDAKLFRSKSINMGKTNTKSCPCETMLSYLVLVLFVLVEEA